MLVDPRVSRVSDHQQVETLFAGEFDHRLHFVSPDHRCAQVDSAPRRAPFALGGELFEVGVLFFDLVADFVDGLPVMNRALFHADHVERGAQTLGQLQCRVESFLRPVRAIMRNQDLFNHG